MKNKEKKELSLAASGIIGYCLIIAGAILSIVTMGKLLDINKWFVPLSVLGFIIALIGSFFMMPLICENEDISLGVLILFELSMLVVVTVGIIDSFAIISIFQ